MLVSIQLLCHPGESSFDLTRPSVIHTLTYIHITVTIAHSHLTLPTTAPFNLGVINSLFSPTFFLAHPSTAVFTMYTLIMMSLIVQSLHCEIFDQEQNVHFKEAIMVMVMMMMMMMRWMMRKMKTNVIALPIRQLSNNVSHCQLTS